jgi:hypothetical protein
MVTRKVLMMIKTFSGLGRMWFDLQKLFQKVFYLLIHKNNMNKAVFEFITVRN